MVQELITSDLWNHVNFRSQPTKVNVLQLWWSPLWSFSSPKQIKFSLLVGQYPTTSLQAWPYLECHLKAWAYGTALFWGEWPNYVSMLESFVFSENWCSRLAWVIFASDNTELRLRQHRFQLLNYGRWSLRSSYFRGATHSERRGNRISSFAVFSCGATLKKGF